MISKGLFFFFSLARGFEDELWKEKQAFIAIFLGNQ